MSTEPSNRKRTVILTILTVFFACLVAALYFGQKRIDAMRNRSAVIATTNAAGRVQYAFPTMHSTRTQPTNAPSKR